MNLAADAIYPTNYRAVKKLPNFGHLVSHIDFNDKMNGFSPTEEATYKITYKIDKMTPTYIKLTPLIFSLNQNTLKIGGICNNQQDKTLTFSGDSMESYLVTACGDKVTFTLTTAKVTTMTEASQGFLIELQGIYI